MKKYYVTVNGKRYEVEVEEVKGDFEKSSQSAVTASAERTIENKSVNQQPIEQKEVKAEQEVPKSAESAAPKAQLAEGEKIECPMPGTIVRIDVTPGDSIKKGEVLMVLEAMKMENEIMSPRDCKIISVNVTKGSTVDTGEVLLVIE